MEPDTQVLGNISLNGSVAHVSHNLSVCRGLHYCVKCGEMGHKKLMKLAKRCEGTAQDVGKRALIKYIFRQMSTTGGLLARRQILELPGVVLWCPFCTPDIKWKICEQAK